MTLARFFLLLAWTLALSCCTPQREAPSPHPAVPPDTELCAPMCAALVKAGCEEGKPTYDSDKPGPRGVPNISCTDLCIQLQGSGYFVNPKCVMQVTTCAKGTEVEEARKKKCD